MTPEEREKINSLCLQIQNEKEPSKFDRLVCELNDLLAARHTLIEHKYSKILPFALRSRENACLAAAYSPLSLDFLQSLHFMHAGDFAQARHDLFEVF